MIPRVYYDASGRQKILNLLENLGVMTALAPPGGAAHEIKVVSSTSFQSHSPLMYRPFLSRKSLRSSIGGCAPYSSTAGMLISSMNTAIFLPAVAPRVFLFFFSSFSSILYCVLFDVV